MCPLDVYETNLNLNRVVGYHIFEKVMSKSLFVSERFPIFFVPFGKSNPTSFWHVEARKFSKSPLNSAPSKHFHSSPCSVQWSECHGLLAAVGWSTAFFFRSRIQKLAHLPLL